MGGPHNFVMAPPIAVEDITSATAFTEGHPTVVGFLPSGKKPTEFQQRVGRFAIDTGGDRRIHGLTVSTVFADAEVTNVPQLWATCASRGALLHVEQTDAVWSSMPSDVIRRGRRSVCILVRWCRLPRGIHAPL